MLTPTPLIRSGFLASGQVGWPHHASGCVRSGHLGITAGTPDGSKFLRDDFAWVAPAFALTSGQVGSGLLASGSVPGFFGPYRGVMSGTLGVFDFGSGAVVAGAVGSGSVLSGNVASGQLGPNHGSSGYVGVFQLGSGSVLSGNLASGAVAQFALSSGAVNSGHVGSGAVQGSVGGGAFAVASGSLGPNDLGSGAVRSGALASGQVGWTHLASGSVNSGDVTSGTVAGFFGPVQAIQSGSVGVWDLGSGAVIAGAVGSGAVQSGNVASGQIGTNHIASGRLTGFELGSGAVVSGRVASGQIGTNHLASGGVQSGNLLSGNVGQMALASGCVNSGHLNTTAGTPGATTFLRGDFTWAAAGGGSPTSGTQTLGASTQLAAFFSGGANTILTAEIVSGGRAVSLNLSGTLQVAMAGQSGRMPAIGVVLDNVLSGVQANVYWVGDFQHTSGLADYSGYLGQPLYVGRSGHVVTVSGSWNSGGLLSGDITQCVGAAYTSAGALVGVAATLPFVLNPLSSGQLASGQVSTYHFSSGAAAPAALGGLELISGLNGVLTAETISGVRAVAYNQSGQLQIAMAAVSGRMPAIGVAFDNALSGIQVNVWNGGFFQLTSGMANFSGYLGRPVWVGRSGQLVQASGSWTSAAFASGDVGQKLGTVANSGAVLLNVGPTAASGGPTAGHLGGAV